MRLKLSAITVALAATLALGTALTGATAAYATPGHSHSCTPAPGIIAAKGPGVFPHSADYDPNSGTFVVGSLAHSTLSSVGPDGTVRTLVDDKDMVSLQAVRMDSARNRIVATNVDYGLADRSTPATKFRIAGSPPTTPTADAGSGTPIWTRSRTTASSICCPT